MNPMPSGESRAGEEGADAASMGTAARGDQEVAGRVAVLQPAAPGDREAGAK
jgi:hypothetical protein